MVSASYRTQVLLVGAGAMGKVLARHLCLAGCDVSFLLRPGSADRLPRELVYYPLNDRNARQNPLRMDTPPAFVGHPAMEGRQWDQIYLCVPSQALRGDLPRQLSLIEGSPTIVKAQPGLCDHSLLSAHVHDSRMVDMFLSFAGYAAPLEGESVPTPGVAYWMPPLSPSLVNVSSDRAQDVYDTLKRGGINVRKNKNVDALVRFTLAFQAPICAALACAGFRFSAEFEDRWLDLAWKGSKQAIAAAERHMGRRAPLPLRHFTPGEIMWIVRGLRKVSPFSVDAYLAAHYMKLHEQSGSHVDDYIAVGASHGLPVDALEELREAMDVGAHGSSFEHTGAETV